MLVDYHVHAVAHGEYAYTKAWIDQFIQNARQRKLREIGFTEHDEYQFMIDFPLLESLQQEYTDVQIRLGLEVDYIPGRENQIKQILSQYNYDYIIGSVHFIDGWGFDHPDFKQGFKNQDIDEIYEQYFKLVMAAAESKLFDVVGHMDLIKIWGHRPVKKQVSYYVEPVLKSIKEAGMVIEINSSGLRKPVGEIYPAPEILGMMFALDVPITLGSDAHHPDQLGEGLEEAVLQAKKAGYRYINRLQNHKKYLMPL